MALAYRPPGLSISEVVTPSISALLADPALICLVGLATGFQTRTDQFTLVGTTAQKLPGLQSDQVLSSVLSVKDSLNPSKGATDGSGYALTTDYTVQVGAGTITRVAAGSMPDGALVNVTYQYVPNDYFLPTRLYDQSSVESRYGSAINTTGDGINSAVSYGAQVAFENGASSVVIQALHKRATPGDLSTAASQPNATEAATVTTWADSLAVLRDLEDINIVVPIVGQSQANVSDAVLLSIFNAVQDHCQFMRSEDQYVVGLFGEDSSASTTVATKTILRGHAATLQGRYGGVLAEQSVLVSPSRFSRALPTQGRDLAVGGQYMAAAIAGMLASQPVSASLTRRSPSGFNHVLDTRLLSDKNLDAGAGLFVVEEKRGTLVVRHSITLDTTAAARRELSVVRAKHRMIESVKDTLDRQIIGRVIANADAPTVVSTTVANVLEQLRASGDLVDYTGLQARFTSLDPTTIQVRFSYRPAFPVNYIDIVFSLDMTTNDISDVTTT